MNHLKNPLLILAFFVGLLLISCVKIEPMTIVNEQFSLDLWSDWELEIQQGIDTYVGFFTNGHEKIEYDYGTFVGGNFDAVIGDPGVLYVEETMIDSFPAKIVKTQYAAESILELLIDKGDGYNKAVVYVRDSKHDERYIAIFKTFHFL